MRCVIEDKSTPKTGGVKNQCPQNRRITFQARNFGFRISTDLSGRIMRNEPNLIPPSCLVPQLRKTNPICHPDSFAAPPFPRNEPNSHKPTAAFHETNPISGTPALRNYSLFYKTSTLPIDKSPVSDHIDPDTDKQESALMKGYHDDPGRNHGIH